MDLLHSLESSLESLTLTRLICSIISIVSCLIIIILYIISIIHMTFKKKKMMIQRMSHQLQLRINQV